MKKVELLAPAGNFEAMLGAFAAGADAVYLGGNTFGARAYADNFSEEEIIRGIHLAHLLGKRIYLTVNTLVKEREFNSLYDFLLPLYTGGLDGVIVQDLGVFQYIKKQFPGMELQVSTQMTVTGVEGARFLKEEGAVRIVPARELSLEEIKDIKENVNVEIETFIHGAMCYCYSGQCLFSSILGGRSGNRGRCAQPCRLPYRVEQGNEQYPLSMKDMCTLNLIPELIEAGIDSFKIEGRMKKPEYAAGVTALYRKYIDLYYQNPKQFKVENSDFELLKKLYIRSDIQEGYYHQHNGKNMITPTSPAYVGSNEMLLEEIRCKYLQTKLQIPVNMSAVFIKGQPASITLDYRETSITVQGDVVQQAVKQPLEVGKIKEQLSKSGNTDFIAEEIIITADNDIFMPVSALNKLRRDAYEMLEKTLHTSWERIAPDKLNNDLQICSGDEKNISDVLNEIPLHVLVSNIEQLYVAVNNKVKRIYVEAHMINHELIQELIHEKATYEGEFYLAFPHVVRKKNLQFMNRLYEFLQGEVFVGGLVRNLETISYLIQKGYDKKVVTDNNLYTWNQNALSFYQRYAKESYLPLELNKRELHDLKRTKNVNDDAEISVMVYGRIPMMISANCLKKTTDVCDKKAGFVTLTDRYQKEFPVYTNCSSCYNVIYNSVPLSLHKLFENKKDFRFLSACRLDFTTEESKECERIIQYFQSLIGNGYEEPFYKEFTTGHMKRGVE